MTVSMGGANNQGIAGGGANVNGNGNTVIYNNGVRRTLTPGGGIAGGACLGAVMVMFW